MLCTVLSVASEVRSSRSSTVAPRPAKKCFRARIWRRYRSESLGEQPDFGEAVDDDARRFDPLERLENSARRLAEFEVGGIQQALLLVGVENAVRRSQFEDDDPLAEFPTMRCSPCLEFRLRLRKRDVEPDLTAVSALHQVAERDRGLAGPGASFQKKDVSFGKTAA